MADEWDDDLELFQKFLEDLGASKQYTNWRRDNCGKAQGGTPTSPAPGTDVALWDAFKDDVLAGKTPLSPDLKTAIGDAFVHAGEMSMSISRLVGAMRNPFPPPDPPPGPTQPPLVGPLTWAPPGYVGGDPKNPANFPGYQVRHINNSSLTINGGFSNQDAYIIWDEVITNSTGEKRVIIQGWRNVVIIGGERNNSVANLYGTNGAGLQVDRCNGIVHLEGIKMYGPGLGDGFVGTTGPETGGQPGAIVRLQNCYVRNNAISDLHADGIQLWSDPGGGYNGGFRALNSDRLTIHSTWQGIFLGTHDGVIQSFDFRNTNIVGVQPQTGATHVGMGWIFFKGCYPDKGGFFGTGGFTNTWTDNELYRALTGVAYVNNVTPNSAGNDGSGGTPCHLADKVSRRCIAGTDATGSFINWPNTGSDISGKIYIGRPPTGAGGIVGTVSTPLGNTDFCPINGNVGMSYVPPGYQ